MRVALDLGEDDFNQGLIALCTAGLLRLLGRSTAAAQRGAAACAAFDRALGCAPERWPHAAACRARRAEAATGRGSGG